MALIGDADHHLIQPVLVLVQQHLARHDGTEILRATGDRNGEVDKPSVALIDHGTTLDRALKAAVRVTAEAQLAHLRVAAQDLAQLAELAGLADG